MATLRKIFQLLLAASFVMCVAQRIDFRKFSPEYSFSMAKVQYGLSRLLEPKYRGLRVWFYPQFFYVSVKVKDIDDRDTLKYNWNGDTIININFYEYYREPEVFGIEREYCCIFSNSDNIFASSRYNEFRRTEHFLTERFTAALREWNVNYIIEKFTDPKSARLGKISRIVINDGKVAEFDTITMWLPMKSKSM